MAMKRRRRKHRRNPAAVPVLFANPRKRRHKRRRARGRRRGMPAALRRYWASKRSGGHKRRRRRNPSRALVRYSAPKLVRRRRRRHGGIKLHRVHRRRRRNPMRLRSLTSTLRLIFFGGLGVVAARLGKFYYGKYVGGHVAGDGSSKLRTTANEVLNLVAMALATLGIERGLKMIPMVNATDRIAFRYGGLGETGRQAIGVVVKMVRPSTDLKSFGLDGLGRGLRGLEPADSFMGLEQASSFAGLEPTDSFMGMGDGLGAAAHRGGSAGHGPFSHSY